MTLKQHYPSFMLFMYNDHIQEDWSEWLPIGKSIIYPFWIIRAIVLWILSPLFIPEYFIKRSIWYKSIVSSYDNFLNTSLNSKQINKISTNAFLNKKYGARTFKFQIRKNKK